jgi:hypothetical protein
MQVDELWRSHDFWHCIGDAVESQKHVVSESQSVDVV